MKVKKWLCAFWLLVASLAFSITASAENWVRMGYLSKADWGPIKTDSMGHNWAYDRDTMYIDKENNIIEVSIKDNEPTGKIWLMNYYSVSRVRIHFFADPKQCYFTELYVDDYSKKTDKHLERNEIGNSMVKDFSMAKINECYMPFVFWKEFGYYLDLPNQDGKPYVTPKSLGLTWGASNSKIGVFYYPKTLAVRGNRIYVKLCLWRPYENGYEIVDGFFDYANSSFYGYSSVVQRISSGDNKQEFKALPGKVSKPLPYDKYEEVQFAANYFKQFL